MQSLKLRPGVARNLTSTCPRRPAQNRRAVVTAANTESSSWTGKIVSPPSKGHHFLHIDDFSREELLAMLSTAVEVKEKIKSNDQSFKPFLGKTLAMIFTKPSMRTRVSFETVRFPI